MDSFNMKGGVRKKEYAIFVYGNFVVLPIVGWSIGGAVFAAIGFTVALVIDFFFPTWKYELTWRDIDLALNNIYRYGRNPSEMSIWVGKRRIYVYRDEKSKKEKSIRMAVRLPVSDWSDLLNENDYKEIVHRYGTMRLYTKDRGAESYGIFAKNGPDDCSAILKVLFQKSVGGLRPDIYAESLVNANKNVWLDHSDKERDK